MNIRDSIVATKDEKHSEEVQEKTVPERSQVLYESSVIETRL